MCFIMKKYCIQLFIHFCILSEIYSRTIYENPSFNQRNENGKFNKKYSENNQFEGGGLESAPIIENDNKILSGSNYDRSQNHPSLAQPQHNARQNLLKWHQNAKNQQQFGHKMLHHAAYDKRNQQNQYARYMNGKQASFPVRSNVYDQLDNTDYLNQNIDTRKADQNDEMYDYDAGVNFPYSQIKKKKRHAKKEQESKFDEDDLGDNTFGYNDEKEETAEKDNKNQKRSAPAWSNDQIMALKTSLAAIQQNSDEYDHLKSILSDMGLIDNISPVKRDLEEEQEDENLNTKEIKMKRNVKKRSNEKVEMEQNNVVQNNDKKRKSEKETDSSSKLDKAAKKKAVTSEKNTEKKSTDDERKKRESPAIKESNGVQGANKIVAEKSIEQPAEEKIISSDVNGDAKMISSDADKEKVSKRNVGDDYEQYEQMIEAQIEEKINAIKEKVKRAIMGQKQNHLRSKRHASLLDSESNNLNSGLISKESLQPHVRTRRNVDSTSEKVTTKNDKQGSIDNQKNVEKKDTKQNEIAPNKGLNDSLTIKNKTSSTTITTNLSSIDFLDEETFLLLPDDDSFELVKNEISPSKNHPSTKEPSYNYSSITNNFLSNWPNLHCSRNVKNNSEMSDKHMNDNNTNHDDGQLIKHFLVNNTDLKTRRRRESMKDSNEDENCKADDDYKMKERSLNNVGNEQTGDQDGGIGKESQAKLTRRKRSNLVLPERRIVYRPYLQSQDEEEEFEGGVFDNIDDPTYIEKRDANNIEQEYVDQQNINDDQRIARSGQNYQDYSSDYGNADYDQNILVQDIQAVNQFADRGKRDNENSEMHGGLVSNNKKNLMKNKIRNKSNIDKADMEEDSVNNVESEFFGGLQQNYQEGELNRYKRVKRTNDVAKTNE